MKSAGDRIRRLLLVIPYAARHPGVRLSVLSSKLGVTPARLQRDLECLCCIGQPPFGPDDLIDVEVCQGRVFVHLAQNFTHPPRLTLREACALWASAQLAMPLLGKAIAQTRERIQAALAAKERGEFARICQQLCAAQTPIDASLSLLARAIRELCEVRFDELIAERVQVISRLVEPWSLCERKGQWQLEGFSVRERVPRTFVVERLSAPSLTGRHFERRGRRAIDGPREAQVLVEADEALVPWLLEMLPATELGWGAAPGQRALDIRACDPKELARIIASLGGRVTVRSPRALARAVAEVARQALERHGANAGAPVQKCA